MRRTAAAFFLLALVGVAAAAPISVGQTLTGQRFEWRRGYNQRWKGTYGQYEATLTAGTTYEIFTSDVVAGSTSDPYLYVMSTAEQILAQDDDSGGNNNARIVFTPSATGTYWVRLRAYSKNRYGFCSLTVREQAPPPPPTEVVIGPGDVLNGQIFEWRTAFASRSDGTYGQYRIDMVANTVYTFETSDSVGGGNDTYLYLLNSTFTVVRYDDDSGAGYHSRLTFQPAADGTYYLRLRAYSQGASGTCRLTCTGSAGVPGNPLEPDLIVWPDRLRDAYISNEGGRKLMRFSNGVPNIGRGPLEVYGVVDAVGNTQAYQVVYNDSGSQTTYLVGTFSFAGHETHNHWHLDDFALYELRSTGGTLVRGDKVSFCLMDVTRYDASLPGSPASSAYTCSNQGISVGWADIYGASLDGQFIDVTGVADGTYQLVSIVDPLGRLRESNKTNNSAQVTVTISGNSVTVQP